MSFAGKHFTIDDATVEPKPHRPGGPPIWIGGSGPTALREAARFDAWFPTGPSVEFFAEQFPGVQAAARAAGRAPDAVTGAAYRHARARSQRGGRGAAAGRVPRELLRGARAGAQGAPGHATPGLSRAAAEWLQRWIDAGVRHIALRFAGGDQLAQVDEAAARLLPRLKR